MVIIIQLKVVLLLGFRRYDLGLGKPTKYNTGYKIGQIFFFVKQIKLLFYLNVITFKAV